MHPLGVLLVLIIIAIMVALFFLPGGRYIRAEVHITGDNITKLKCDLITTRLIPIEIVPEESLSKGDKTLILTVSLNDNEIIRMEKENVGEGTAIFRTKTLPDIKSEDNLLTNVLLYRGDLLLTQTSQKII